ncbi:MAG: endonuclease NucS [Candidatus Nanohaloarchaeota archaeon QJJ-9]|nr:endonuclease NucS [Candidatus Nanohaloarchaeota archaeon QJJ-9]
MEKLVESPSKTEAKELLEEYLRRNYTVTLTGLCSVNYQGRTKSKLDRGERLVIVKQDNSLLVHGPENYQPKNWQPDTDQFNLRADKEELILESKRNNPEETVEIRFGEIEMLHITQLVDKSDLKIKGHEIDIHEAIEENPELVEEDLKIVEREKETDAGFIDVFARSKDNQLVVIEVKRNPDHNSVLQLGRYVDEIEEEYPGREIRGILVAPKCSDNVKEYLEKKNLEFVEVDMEDVIPSYESLDQSQAELNQFQADYET